MAQDQRQTVTSPTDSNFDRAAGSLGAGLVVRLWRGEVPLVRTYWLYGVLLGLLLRLVTTAIATVEGLLTLWLPVYLAYLVLIFVAIWRSAARYRGRKLWAAVARMQLMLGVGLLGVTLLSRTRGIGLGFDEPALHAAGPGQHESLYRALAQNMRERVAAERIPDELERFAQAHPVVAMLLGSDAAHALRTGLDITEPSVDPGTEKLGAKEQALRNTRYFSKALKGAFLSAGLASGVGIERLHQEGELAQPRSIAERVIIWAAPMLAGFVEAGPVGLAS